jgi:hypothetical protein
MTGRRGWAWTAAFAAALGCAALAVRAKVASISSPRDRHPYLELRVPRVLEPIAINAETEGKKVWEPEAGGTGVFKDTSGQGMVPYTEAKARWMPGMLYLLLYAGDLDLEGSVTSRDGPVLRDDAFHIELGREGHVYTLDVSVLGTVADADCAGAVGETSSERRCDDRWDSHALVAVDRDGTLNQVGDNDEEWVVEMAIPFASLGMAGYGEGDRIPFAIRRCEVGKSGPGACGGFGTGKVRGEIVLEPDWIDGPRVASGSP